MAHKPTLSNLAADAAADAVTSLLDGGYLRIYDGVQPSTADSPIGKQRLLAELRYANPAFYAAVDGIAKSHAIDGEPSARASGRASFTRSLDISGLPVFDGSVGTRNADTLLDSVDIEEGSTITMSYQTYQQQKG